MLDFIFPSILFYVYYVSILRIAYYLINVNSLNA